ncbi:uncharacterized protein LOC135400572 [Ornithodoros turicata]|uniref:uncharacterized protein LOC135400572 n=1 Tax=Ornithodoros turicata TaxID=34597 RepID=UPI0031390386
MPREGQLDRLKRTRAGIRGMVTRTIAHLEECLARPDIPKASVEVDMDYLVARKAALCNLDQQILELIDDDAGFDEENNAVLEQEKRIEAAISQAKRALREQLHTTGDPPSQPSRTASLPKLQIPKFGGKLQDWQRFWEHYDATIHGNASLAPVEKFKYLLSFLTDDAKRAIDGIGLSGDNYATAILTLKQRFGCTDLLSAEHLDKLLALHSVNSCSDVAQLRHLYDEASRHTKALESLGIPRSSYDVVLYRVLTRCIPIDLFVQFQHSRKADAASGGNSGGGAPSADGPRTFSKAEQVTALLTFLRVQVESREEAAFHRPRHVQKDNTEGTLQPVAASLAAEPHPATAAAPSPVQATPASMDSTVILLQSAAVDASGPGGKARVQILLDNGSQRTFIREDLAMSLQCATIDVEDLAIYAFGSTQSARHRCSKVTVNITGRDATFELALTIPEICKSLSPSLDPHLTRMLLELDLQPASTSGVSRSVDILVGADNYWRLVTGRILRMTEDLTAVETVFGWVIQGSTAVHTRLHQSTCALLLTCGDPESECNAEDLWKLDTLGITSPEPTASHVCSTDFQVFEAGIAKSKERYEIPLMTKKPGLLACFWVYLASQLPPGANNKATAVHRLGAQL